MGYEVSHLKVTAVNLARSIGTRKFNHIRTCFFCHTFGTSLVSPEVSGTIPIGFCATG